MTVEPVLGGLGEEYRTRPGTPMIGPYSTNQMDDLYAALGGGQVKPTGVMNLLQKLYIAQRCEIGESVVDVCCGRGMQLPVLYRYAPHIASYIGLDISPDNLREARDAQARLDELNGGGPFGVVWLKHDVARPWPELGTFDVAVYTSALEHLPRPLGVASLRHTATALRPGGRLYLSTPNTAGAPPRRLQHRVHVYEWNADELEPVLDDCGLLVDERVGLLSPAPDDLAQALIAAFGPGAAAWYQRLRETVPGALLDAIVAAALPEVAAEVLYVCRRPR